MIKRGNFATNIPDASREEVIEELAAFPGRNVRVERIHSDGQSSPGGFWYDQDWAEWVLVLRGGAEVEFSDPAGIETLSSGDWLLIPANRRHRVASTRPDTLWLAIHADGPETTPPTSGAS